MDRCGHFGGKLFYFCSPYTFCSRQNTLGENIENKKMKFELYSAYLIKAVFWHPKMYFGYLSSKTGRLCLDFRVDWSRKYALF